MHRIAFIGCPGAGKTTLAREIARRRGLPHIELDAIFHQPGWQGLPTEEFRVKVTDELSNARHGWTVDGNYNTPLDGLVQGAADTIVWLDPPKWLVMSRVIRRTLRRVITREELWNGNREPWTNLYSRNPDKNIIVWSWTQFAPYRTQYEAKLTDGSWEHARVIRLGSKRETREWLENLTT